MTQPCGDPKCRAYQLTVREFERLGGEAWSHSFRVKLGRQAGALYFKLYRKRVKPVRASAMASSRNKVGKYPCGVLEQALRELNAGSAQQVIVTAEASAVASPSAA
jgi:hypothetical protein